MSRPAWIDDLDLRAATRSGLLLAVGPRESAAFVAEFEAIAGPVLLVDGLGSLSRDFAEAFDPSAPGCGQWLPASMIAGVESGSRSAVVDLSRLPAREAAELARMLLEAVEELPASSRPVVVVAGPERLFGDDLSGLEAVVLVVEQLADLAPPVLRKIETVVVSADGAGTRELSTRARLVGLAPAELAELPEGVVAAAGPAVYGDGATWVLGEGPARAQSRALGWIAGTAAVAVLAAVAPTVGVMLGAAAGAVLGVGAIVGAARR